jgi:hypothetical protein
LPLTLALSPKLGERELLWQSSTCSRVLEHAVASNKSLVLERDLLAYRSLFIHPLMGHADDVNAIVADEIESQVRALWEAVIARADVGTVLAAVGVFRQPAETIIQRAQVTIALCVPPLLPGVARRCSSDRRRLVA